MQDIFSRRKRQYVYNSKFPSFCNIFVDSNVIFMQLHSRSLQAFRGYPQTEMLVQNSVGEDCTQHWNCLSGLVHGRLLLASCHSISFLYDEQVCRDLKCEYCLKDSECIDRNSKYRVCCKTTTTRTVTAPVLLLEPQNASRPQQLLKL